MRKWSKLASIFLDDLKPPPLLRMQKKAYRRGNGGNSAPALLEDVKPRVVRDRLDRLSEVQAIQQRSHGKELQWRFWGGMVGWMWLDVWWCFRCCCSKVSLFICPCSTILPYLRMMIYFDWYFSNGLKTTTQHCLGLFGGFGSDIKSYSYMVYQQVMEDLWHMPVPNDLMQIYTSMDSSTVCIRTSISCI